MTRHQKRLSVPNSWPVARKEETYTVKAGAGPHGESGVPLVVLLRDVLGYVDSDKEARYAIEQDSVLVNGEPVADEERPIGMFDILEFAERDEHYRVFPDEGGRLALTPIEADDAGSRLGKVVGKRQVPGGDTQLTLHDGATLLADDDRISANDSIVVDNDDGEVVAHFPYEEGALVTAVQGQHAGDVGTIDEIQVTPGSSPNNVLVDSGTESRDEADGRFETIEEYVVVIDENFVGDDGDEPEDATEAAAADVEEGEATEEVDDDVETEDATDGSDDESDEDEPVADDADEAGGEESADGADEEPDGDSADDQEVSDDE